METLTAAQKRALIQEFGWTEFLRLAENEGVGALADQLIAARAKPERPAETPTTVQAIDAQPKQVRPVAAPKTLLCLEVVTQDFDDLHTTDEYHDVKTRQRLYLGSFNTRSKRVVFRDGRGRQIVGTAVTPKGNPIKSSESDGIYTDRALGTQFMYVAVAVDQR